MHDHDYPFTLFYAFKQAETSEEGTASTGWETMLEGLLDAGVTITGTWPIRTEQPGGLREVGRAALASSIVLVCRRRPADATLTTRRDFLSALRAELPEALRRLQQGNIAPVDLAQASIGPGMAVFSRYTWVVEADGSAMSVSTALSIINDVLGEILDGEEAELDPDTRFALTWFSQHGYNPARSGDAESVARAKNTSLSGIEDAGFGEARAGLFRLYEREELKSDWSPLDDDRLTVWEVTQHLIRAQEEGGEQAAASLLRAVGGLADPARELAYRLYHTSERKG